MSGNPAEWAGEPVEVTYQASDVFALNSVLWRFWVSSIAIFLVILILLPVGFQLVDGESLGAAFAAIDWLFTGEIALFVAGLILLSTIARYWWRRRKGLWGPIIFSLSREGLSFRNKQMNGLIFWAIIKSIRIRADRLFFVLGPNLALILPKRAFDNDEDFMSFVGAAQAFWTQRSEEN